MEYNAFGQYILPDNTAAIVHAGDRFAQMEAQRKAQKAAQQKADQERWDEFYKNTGKALEYNPTGTPQDKFISDELNKTMAEAAALYKQTGDQGQVDMYIRSKVPVIATYGKHVKEYNDRMAKQLADLKDDDGLDPIMAVELAKKDKFYKRDQNGDLVPKTLEEVINGDERDINDIITENAGFVYKDKYAGLNKAFADIKPMDVEQPSKYDEKTGDRVFTGYKGKLPTGLVDVVTDEKGKPKVQLKSEFYRFDDGTIYYDPQTKKPVSVLPSNIEQDFMSKPSVRNNIESEVRKRLETDVNNFNGDGQQMHGPDSPYADFLRKKILYEKVSPYADKFTLTEDEDKSMEKKNAIKGMQIREANLKLAKEDNWLAKKKFEFQKLKESKKEQGINITPYTEYAEQNFAQEAEFMGEPSPYYKVVLAKDLDPATMKTITGNGEPDKEGEPKKDDILPYNYKGQQSYLIDKVTGDWFGVDSKGGLQRIDRTEAFRRQVNDIETQTRKTPVPKRKSFIQTAKDLYKKATGKQGSGIPGIGEGGLD